MKITVNYSVNEALETVKTSAAVATEMGKTPNYTSKMIDMILDDKLNVEHKSKGTRFAAKHNEFSFEISDTMYLEVLPLIIKFANVVTPIVRGFYNLLQMGNGFDGLKSSFKEFRKNWSVDIKDNKFCLKTIETDDFGTFKIIMANDGYHTYVYQVNYDIPDYRNKDIIQAYVDALIMKYNNTAMDTSEFTMTYDEVDKIVKLHD